MKIQGCVALVTGANRGLGRALVGALVDAGAAKVYAASRRQGEAGNGRIVPLELDTTRPEQVAAAVRAAADVTLLINNAGVLTSADVLASSPSDLDADFRTNVHGTLAMVKAFEPVLARAGGSAAIVNVLSLTALASFPALGGYSASKAAAYSITQALRAKLKEKRIEVLAVLPGPLDTDMVKGLSMPKTAPSAAAKAVIAGIERGDEEIFPDPMAVEMGAVWRKDPKGFERAFASL
jgi:NAD(P)-dependent dehydrogenase (short-subunit alcohol dehydrogenase family)